MLSYTITHPGTSSTWPSKSPLFHDHWNVFQNLYFEKLMSHKLKPTWKSNSYYMWITHLSNHLTLQ